nr:MAG TPA: hypothetical protein [Caudoviricetes sp.]
MILGDLFRGLSGRVLIFCADLFADRRHIAQMPDIPLRLFWFPDLPPCSGDGIRAHFSGCLSC